MNKIIQKIILLLTISVIIYLLYGKVLRSPNSYIFGAQGDGLKNYYSIAYHLKHDSSFTHFQGMNYPYGEHIFYTDGQPFLSNVLWFTKFFFNDVENYTVGILNLLIILSIIVSAYFILLIFMHYKIKSSSAIIYTIGITLLSPQIARFGGHYSLSYLCFLPISWYLFLKTLENNFNTKWIVYFLINNLFWVFIHAYLGLILAVFIITFIAVKFAFNLSEYRTATKKYIPLLVIAILPLFVVKIILFITDYHIDRTNSPFGLFEYTAEFETIFLPHHGFFHKFLFNAFNFFNYNFPIQTWEGWSYIGISSILAIIFYSVYLIRLIILKKVDLTNLLKDNKTIFIITSFVTLFFSMGLFFSNGFENVLTYVPALKQFRALGRFSWIFYYVVTILGAVFIINQILLLKPRLLRYLLMPIFPLLMVLEALPFHKEMASNISSNKNPFGNTFSSNYKVPENKYQAIIAFPFYHIGSESVGKNINDKSYQQSLLYSYYTGLPLLNSSLSRTSITESISILQLFSPEYYHKEIISKFNQKPFLVLNCKEKLSPEEYDFLNKCTLVQTHSDFDIYEVYLHRIMNDTASFKAKKIYDFNTQILHKKANLLVSDSLLPTIYKTFNSLEKNTYDLNKDSSFSFLKKKTNTLFSFDLKEYMHDTISISFWFYSKGETQPIFTVIYEEILEEGNGEWVQYDNVQASFTINDGWSLYHGNFTPKKSSTKLNLLLQGYHRSSDTIFINNLLIRPLSIDVYKKYDNGFMKNNHFISRNFD